ncbi:MAG: pyridoxal-phosphate dependent enzyme, partial [Acidimicrobiales bacterium]
IEAAGAEVVTFDRSIADREALALERVRATGATFVHPFEDRDIMLGQGTTAVELHEQVGDLDLLLVPMSGGGLMAGCASAMAALSPRCRMIGVEPALGDDTRRSFEAGRPVTIEQPATMADGLAVTSPGANTFAINHRLVERIVTVTERQIAAAMVTLRETTGLIVEPSGAVGIAALLAGLPQPDPPAGAEHRPRLRIGVILSGGNIDDQRFEELTATADRGSA